jgi:2-keto-4-pentenoate hydratase/2-oxohepta-3-ene-1,7-dioic acid hydratase in catechol pathway
VTTVTTIRPDPAGKATKAETTSTVETLAPNEVPTKFRIPQAFFKTPSCLVPPDGQIVIPKDATVVDYEGEMVIVIGRRAKNVPKESALDYVLGVTCGNDVSERNWQKNDVQWWRAKSADTFGPCGPFIVSGLNYDDLLVQLRLNGEVKQKERTSQLIHDVRTLVSTLSRYVTLEPGDLIYTGTSGKTSPMKAGDVVEVELEGVGVLRNPVVAER